MKRASSVATVLATLLFVASGGAVQATSPTPASGPTWAPNQRVEYRWKAGSEPPTWMRAAVNAAASDSNSSRASRAAVLDYAERRRSAGSAIRTTCRPAGRSATR